MLNGHGDDGYLYQTPIVANFSSNVFYGGLSDSLRHHLTSILTTVTSYPDVAAERLACLVASAHMLNGNELLITNGATEAFYLIAHAFRCTAATVIIPAFAEYEDACRANDIQLQFLHWNEFKTEQKIKTDLLFVCNPNNPTGTVIDRETIERLIAANPNTTFVLDEAYIDFTNAIRSSIDLATIYQNVIVVRSMTKVYSIPGLRLGYLVSNSQLISRILSFKMPWSVNTMAIEAGMFILQHKEDFILPLDKLLQEARQLQHEITMLPGIQTTESHTNFFLCTTQVGTAASLKEYLVRTHGLLIRDASNFRSLGPHSFRIASQGQPKNELLIKALKEWGNQ